MKRKTQRRLLLLVAAAAILSAFGYLLYSGIGNNLVYFLTPTELMAKGAKAYDAPVRLGGMVAPGSVQWDKDALELRFTITDGAKSLQVHSKGAPPTMFRPGIGVVVEGRFTKAGIFESHSLMVKHSNEYHPPKDGEDPSRMYRSLIRDPEGARPSAKRPSAGGGR